MKELHDFSVVRELRKRENLTISDLSGRSGISPAVISKLERNQTRAELETLSRLARAFGISAGNLLNMTEISPFVKKDTEGYDLDGFHFQRIEFPHARCIHAHANKGRSLSRAEIHRDDFEICWVISGSVCLHFPSEKHVLHEGEALQFDALIEHRYEVLEDCNMTIVHIPKEMGHPA